MAVAAPLLDWMLDSDPALRWQVERDLAGVAEATWRSTRDRVSREGLGARLLALQDADGQWAGGAFFPKDFDMGQPGTAGQPWTATTWSLNSLREWGVAASALPGTAELLAAHSRWEYDGSPYWQGEVDCCINGYTLANGAWLGADVRGIADWFVEHRMSDGGWNCDWVEGSTRSSARSTLNSLEGILFYERATGGTDALHVARLEAQDYLLERRLLRRLSNGELFGPDLAQFGYPFRSFYTALHVVDYFRAASLHDGVVPDERIADAIAMIREARQPDGTWLQARRYPGEVWFDLDVRVGEPSRWLTFYGTRVLEWWDENR